MTPIRTDGTQVCRATVHDSVFGRSALLGRLAFRFPVFFEQGALIPVALI